MRKIQHPSLGEEIGMRKYNIPLPPGEGMRVRENDFQGCHDATYFTKQVKNF
jgi:hypothetical protein